MKRNRGSRICASCIVGCPLRPMAGVSILKDLDDCNVWVGPVVSCNVHARSCRRARLFLDHNITITPCYSGQS